MLENWKRMEKHERMFVSDRQLKEKWRKIEMDGNNKTP